MLSIVVQGNPLDYLPARIVETPGFGWLYSTIVAAVIIGWIGLFRVILGRFFWQRPAKEKKYPWVGTCPGIDTSDTSLAGYMRLAALSPKYTENVQRWLLGNATVDRIKRDAYALADVPEAEVTSGLGPIAVTFRPGEPQRFNDMLAHKSVGELLQVFVANMQPAHCAIKPIMLLGGAGRGKTAIVHVLANEINLRLEELGLPAGHMIEVFGGDIDASAKLDQKIRLASGRPGSVLFVDEVHSMPRLQLERMFMMLDRDARFQFDGERAPTPLAPFTVVFATTDRGVLPEPLRTRMEIFDIEKVPEAEMQRIAMNLPFKIAPEAASLAVSRVKWDGSLRPLINLLDTAREFAIYRGADQVEVPDVESYIRVKGLDDWGLWPQDRAVVAALAKSPKPVRVKRGEPERVVYQVSESTLLGMTRTDSLAYRQEIKPRLMDRGFLMSTSSGQTLTDAGLHYARTLGLL
jgi:Holliday junction resolvasome RuvABC ATP-dependent DNA helicase subunit